MTSPAPSAAPDDAPVWLVPGALVLRLMLVAVLAVALSGAVAAWLVTRASGQEAVRRMVSQQTDEVEVVARLLASKIEQSQKVLRTVAAGITPGMLESPSSLEWLLQQGLPAVQFFDTMQVARDNGELRLNLRAGLLQKAADLDPAERDALRRTLVDGKPLVSELIAGRTSDARVMFTMPLHREDGTVLGVVAGALRLQSQSLLPPSMTLPARDDSQLIVFTRDGTILSHSDPTRILGQVRDEAGLAPVYGRWLTQAQPVVGRGMTHVQPDHIVSMAGMPLPQWIVARVSTSQALLAPLRGAQREAWWLAVASMALCMLLAVVLMGWMAHPLAQLTHKARQLLKTSAGQQSPEDMDWPRAGGEVGDLVRVFQGLVYQGNLQQQHKDTLDGQFQAVLDSASVGIIISRHGMLDVVGRQACVMLGYTAQELQGRPARTVYASDADYVQVGARVRSEMAAHGAFDGDICFMRKDGTPVWARVQGRGVRPDEMHGGTVWILEDITAAREARVQQSWERMHDALTQLYNRAAFDERLGLLMAERSTRLRGADDEGSEPQGDGVVLFLDLDHFTVVNDIAGHDAGDDVLRHVARLLASQVRPIGWAARLGGDEFAVVLPGCALARGQAVAEQLRAAVHAWEPSYQGRSFTLGVSIGLVVLDASLQDVPSVLYAADMACYDAKRAGRNRVETRHARDASVTSSGRMALGPV
ncbi:PAS domain S-box-containing protein/diguanylate cyclase (GGDEF)-like protein [Acidovorax sp. 69]|uniref:sensor domain-containing diguanylate cyclase n=1 Tax=Acidovorax sp. 69 TaxID=2035202 RepID=UPI000C240F45|nr:diguanylate cyclase [Acidovorax sp. 69]PJI98757.1 PAS domain S-box-containing protein/diguanylate cyclase (GGDEF)-like protein [Acidovorax sp. 69]